VILLPQLGQSSGNVCAPFFAAPLDQLDGVISVEGRKKLAPLNGNLQREGWHKDAMMHNSDLAF
jgi:hypothetical protein